MLLLQPAQPRGAELPALSDRGVAVPFGSIPAGGTMRARLGMFFTFRDGRIATQHNYDFLDPF